MNAMTQTNPANTIKIRTAHAGQKAKGLVFWRYPDNGFIDMVKHLSQSNFDKSWAFSPEDVDLFQKLLKAAATGKVDDFVDLLPNGVFAVRFPLFISERKGFKPFADALVDAGVGWGTETSGQLQDASSMLGASDKEAAKPQSERLKLPKPVTPSKPKADGKTCTVNYGGEVNLPNIERVRAVYTPNDSALLGKAQHLFNFFANAVKSGTETAQKDAVHSMVTELAESGVVRIIAPLREGDHAFQAMEAAVARYAPKWFSIKADANFGKSKLRPHGDQTVEQPQVQHGAAKRAAALAKKKARAAKDAAQRLAMRGKTGQKDQPKQRKKK